ncbi:MAG: endopeptidase La [Acidobacteria bacterium]|nr:endopeptidase La [Acidobacteriota bacterium]|tara:strand:+ start:6091 stop:8529 length:2439 start_codon:yes stop_codon:yes gene_type:complete
MSDHVERHDSESFSSVGQPPSIPSEIPVLPIRDTVLFPNAFIPLAVARESSVRLIEDVAASGTLIGVFTQREASTEEPTQDDLYPVGTATHIHKTFKLPDGSLRLIVQGLERLRLLRFNTAHPYLHASVERAIEVTAEEDRLEIDAFQRNIKTNFQQVVSLSPLLSEDLQVLASNIEESGKLADFIASSLTTISTSVKQEVLETLNIRARMDTLNRVLIKELEVLELGSKIQSQVQSEVGKNQRDYFLREQMKAIQKELGEGDEQAKEIEELRGKLERARLPEVVLKEALRELDRLSKMPVAAAEYTVSRTYLDWMVALPWAVRTEEVIDLARTKSMLDEDHSDLEKAKDRILEYLAVRKLNPKIKSPILCFVGPPGVGKTSLAKSIAASLGRKLVRISLGGMRDEAEIRGHRRTYIGALPGQIIQGLRRVESKNPVFVLDEIDKLGADFRGDPASALLEVLDPEQNNTFRDYYLDVPFDLSEILFITTANFLDPVPHALRDRMEVLELSGYTDEEKLTIAREHLVEQQIENHGLGQEHVSFEDAALQAVIRGYTREAGVRNLEREIGALCRKVARRRAEGSDVPVVVTPDEVVKMLGAPKFYDEEVADRTKEPGVAVGLAWTPAGGEVLFVEATLMSGGRTLTLTGQLGDVMKESAQTALSWFRAHAEEYGVDEDFYQQAEIHVHVPSGAIPKDGPSAGVTMATALASRLTKRPVRQDLAMTGEVTLSGRVLPVGGIKEKVLAARRLGIAHVVVPHLNRKNIDEDLSDQLRQEMTIHYVSSVEEVLKLALEPAKVFDNSQSTETPIPHMAT